MLSMPLACTPAGVLGRGSVDARPHTAVQNSLLAPVAAIRGTGVPVTGPARRHAAAPAGIGATSARFAQKRQFDLITPKDGTTHLGLHSPGRPTS